MQVDLPPAGRGCVFVRERARGLFLPPMQDSRFSALIWTLNFFVLFFYHPPSAAGIVWEAHVPLLNLRELHLSCKKTPGRCLASD